MAAVLKEENSQKPRCKGVRVDGAQCNATATIGGFCGRHKSQIERPADWQTVSVEEIERRKQYSLMRKRELEVAEQEGRLVDESVARSECTRIGSMIQETWATFAARRSHEIGSELGVDAGLVAAVLEKHVRLELKAIADSL